MELRHRKRWVGQVTPTLVATFLLALLVVQIASASHLVNLPRPANSAKTWGAPDKGRFRWENYGTTGTWVFWYGYVQWSDQRLWQRENQGSDPQIEFEGWNPGMRTDCDNINHDSYYSTLPVDAVVGQDAAAKPWWQPISDPVCSGNRTDIKEELIVRVNASNGNVKANTTYYVRWMWSKTYLHDANPEWKEVNFTWEEYDEDWHQGKIKYDVRGGADGNMTNGQYVNKCVQPAGAIDNLISCP